MIDPSLAGRIDLIGSRFTETPLVRLEHDRLRLYAKLELNNPHGSVKDRSAYLMLRRAIERAELTAASTVVESSSGNLAISLASFCRILGVPFVPVIDPTINPSTERFLRAACDQVEKVTERDETGGFLRNRLLAVRRLESALGNPYWPNQYGNMDAADAHEEMTGAELSRALDRIDYLFVGVGTGATVAGLSRRMKQRRPQTRIVAVDAEGSAIFGGSPGARRIPGIGSSIRPPLVDQAQIDDVVTVSESATVDACHRLLRRHGLFAGGSSGSAYAAIEEYFQGYRGPPPSVVFLAVDRGTAYADTIYRPGWLDEWAARPAVTGRTRG
ncbi:MAG: 2,3-diaminopropionate biosynthesis protein SbnA [Actinomycetia bacterium]|nr:2,3-diaminopropionate biosynthesis protein SbnA [Actinomycetes bacterium]